MFDLITNKSKNCGVYQFGCRLNKILWDQGVNNKYYECEDLNTFSKIKKKSKIILFNFINASRPTAPLKWLTQDIINELKLKGHIVGVLEHSDDLKYQFDFIVHQNPLKYSNNNLTIPRPLFYDFDNIPFKKVDNISTEILKRKKLIFGSFGLAFNNKGFDKIIHKINNEFESAIIRMHIIKANYNDSNGSFHEKVIKYLKSIKLKNNVSLKISTNFLSDPELLSFLNKNDVNILNYQNTHQENDDGSLSSAVDHAISSRKPFSVSSSHQFKHIDRALTIESNSLFEIISNGSYYNDKYLKLWTHKKIANSFKTYMGKLLRN